jgi:hypothetical protein
MPVGVTEFYRIMWMVYIEPMPKTNITPSLCANGIFNPRTNGIGKKNMTTSVKMLKTQVAIYKAVLSMHVPCTLVSQELRIGLQENSKLKKMAGE